MSADATLVLAGTASELLAIYPAVTQYVVKRPVTGNKPPNGGYNPGWALPCFVISCNENEGVDDDGDFEEVSVKYSINVEAIFAAAAKTASGDNPVYLEDTDIRDVREAVRRRLYKPRVPGLTTLANVSMRAGRVYDMSGAGAMPVIVSPQTFLYEVMEPRAE